jgi:poly-gamma-glutamate synthesis protein (capsule biosynthesis protein)
MKLLPFRSLLLTTLLLLYILLLNIFIQRKHSDTVTLAFLGDIMIGRDVARHHQDGDWSRTFLTISPTLQEADIVFGNLESPICITDSCAKNLYNLNQSAILRSNPDINLCALSIGIPVLNDAGVDFLSLVNNHASDCDIFERVSTEERLNFWKHSKITPLVQDDQPVYLMFNDISFSIFALDDVTNLITLEDIRQQIIIADAKSDFVIVSIHWGQEYQADPSNRQRHIAHILAQSGADIIWGHHPHVLQTTEWIYNNKKNPSFVFYSLGNALFDQVAPADTHESALLLVTVDHDNIANVDAVPFVIDPFLGSVSLASEKISEKINHRLGFSER